jgi:hypothetical protein
MKTHIKRVVVACALVVASLVTPVVGEVELRGIILTKTQPVVGLYDTEGSVSAWATVGRTFQGYRIEEIFVSNERCVLLKDGNRVELKLVQPFTGTSQEAPEIFLARYLAFLNQRDVEAIMAAHCWDGIAREIIEQTRKSYQGGGDGIGQFGEVKPIAAIMDEETMRTFLLGSNFNVPVSHIIRLRRAGDSYVSLLPVGFKNGRWLIAEPRGK